MYVDGFHWTSQAWYYKQDNNLDEIVIGEYLVNERGACTGEFIVEWKDSYNNPQVRIFDDAEFLFKRDRSRLNRCF